SGSVPVIRGAVSLAQPATLGLFAPSRVAGGLARQPHLYRDAAQEGKSADAQDRRVPRGPAGSGADLVETAQDGDAIAIDGQPRRDDDVDAAHDCADDEFGDAGWQCGFAEVELDPAPD